MRYFNSRFKNVKNILPIIAVLISISVIFLDEYHFKQSLLFNDYLAQSQQPQSRREEIRDNLNMLNDLLEQSSGWLNSLESNGQDINNLQIMYDKSENLAVNAKTAFLKEDYDTATSYYYDALSNVENVLYKPLNLDIQEKNKITVVVRKFEYLSTETPLEGSLSVRAYPSLLSMSLELGDDITIKDVNNNPVNTITLSAGSRPYTTLQYEYIASYNLDPMGATFSEPVMFVFDYDINNLEGNFNERDLLILQENMDGNWHILPNITLDTQSHSIKAPISFLSSFALVVKRTPASITANMPQMFPWTYVIIGIPIFVLIIVFFWPIRNKLPVNEKLLNSKKSVNNTKLPDSKVKKEAPKSKSTKKN